MTELAMDTISYRMMTIEDLSLVPTGCQGGADDVASRIQELGSCAVLAFDGVQHIGQLQFRKYSPDCRSPNGLWDPLYWGDFGEHAPSLPTKTISVFCYHVGQLEDTEERDPKYQGKGIGLKMLDFLLEWAREEGFGAVIAKATPGVRKVMNFMGGQPEIAYLQRGFEPHETWVDPELRDVVREKALVPLNAAHDSAASISCCILRL